MLRLRDISLSPEQDGREALIRKSSKLLGIQPARIKELHIRRRSIDARKKSAVRLVYTVDVSLHREEQFLQEKENAPIAPIEEEYRIPVPKKDPDERPMIAGFGPAGMFAALALAEAGLQPVVLERGLDVDHRTEKVKAFQRGGELDPECNVQFGEGGAGTFSDGKLNTGIGGSEAAYVLMRLAEFGAGDSVVWDAAPHVGTDVLQNVVRSIRQRIISLGGEVRFGTQLVDLEIRAGRLSGISIRTSSGMDKMPCTALFLAVGHSARDTMEMLFQNGIPMEAKAFSMGVRIEHLQRELDRTQYGSFAGMRSLGPAPYKLAVHLPDGTGVYTFCMCPGGYVIAAASETGGIVTNGMSYSGRAGSNGNSALLASLKPEQFPYPGPLGGMYWQRELEHRAFAHSGNTYLAPAQLLRDFSSRTPSIGPKSVFPTYQTGVRWCDLREILPDVITEPICSALPLLDKRLPGFANPEAVLTGPETRSSSPVRILRGADYQSAAVKGLYPCGEGAGWAGGIVSAAADALKCCSAYIRSLE